MIFVLLLAQWLLIRPNLTDIVQ